MNTESMPFTLITGASSGIGKALAHRFAQNRHNLLLVSRDETRLQALSEELSSTHGIQSLFFPCDLCEREAIPSILAFIREHRLSINVLINNAGFTLHGSFETSEFPKQSDMLRLHTHAPAELTHALLPLLKEHGAASILNVASLYSFTPVPNQAMYGATKSFLLSFSLALREELAPNSISVCCLCPGITESEIRERAGIEASDSSLSMSAEAVADIAYRGLSNNRAVIVPGLINKLFVLLVSIVPQSLHAKMVRWITYTLRGFKKK